MDIYSFIRSRDVAAHCREIGKEWNTCEMAIIIYRSRSSKKKKFKAWQELIDNYPDMPSTPAFNEEFDSIHAQLKEVIGVNKSSEDLFYFFQYVDIPIPFTRGDILCTDDLIFVLDSVCLGTDERYRKYVQNGNWSDEGWGYFVNETGALYGDHIINFLDCFEYYKGKLEGRNRLLHYVSLYMKDEIGLAALLNMQCRIIAEHLLSINFDIDTHGCFIPEHLLVENRLTPEEKAYIKETNGLMPWIEGKLSIHQIEFLIREFGGSSEAVQSGLENGGGWYLGRCAGIAHDENHYERTGDSKFSFERRAMARMILESYGWTESGWVDTHKKIDREDSDPENDDNMPDYQNLE